MSEEQTPDFPGELSATSAATPYSAPGSAPDAPQYSSRRELREATAKPVVRRSRLARSLSVSRASSTARPATARSAVDRAAVPRPATPTAATRPAAVASRSKKRKHPVVALLVLIVVPGFVATGMLPAYAAAPSSRGQQALRPQSPRQLQALSVDAAAAGGKISRDSFGATTEGELQSRAAAKAARAEAKRVSSLAFAAASVSASASSPSSPGGAYSTVSNIPRAAGDDYPWPGAGNVLSPLRYYYRQCVDFVAWRLNRDAGSVSAPFKWDWSNLTPSGGDASQWQRAWVNHGWKTSSTPIPGSVAWFHGNHVAYVKDVSGPNVVIEEYNGMSSRAYAMRTIPSSSVASFLYPPPR